MAEPQADDRHGQRVKVTNWDEMTADVTVNALGGTEYDEGAIENNLKGRVILWEDTGDTLRSTSATYPFPVEVVGGSTSGTEYTEGETDATISGTAILWEDAADTLATVSAVTPLPVNIVAGSSSGTEYTEGDTDASIAGGAIMWEDAADTLRAVSAAKPLPVNIVAGSSSGVQYTEGDTDASITGTALVLEDAGNALIAATGDVANGLDVDVTRSALPTGAATSAKQDTIIGHIDGVETLLTAIDGHVDGVEGLLTTIDGDTGSIATSAGTIAGAVAGSEMQVDVVTSALPAGAATEAKQDAGIALLTTIDADTSNLSVVGGGTEAAAIRVTIANNSTGVLSVDDNGATISIDDGGGIITVDGTVILGAGTANIGDVDVLTLPSIPAGNNNIGDVDIASIAAGNNNIGDVDVASIAAGDNNIGNVDIVTMPDATVVGKAADDAAVSGNPVLIAGNAVETDGTTPTVVSAEGDVATLRTDRSRRLLVNLAHPFLFRVNENHATAQTNNQLKAAPGANLSLYITDIIISNGATAGTVQIVEDEGGTPAVLAGPYYFGVNGGISSHFITPIRLTTDKSLGFTSVTVTTHSITILGYTTS